MNEQMQPQVDVTRLLEAAHLGDRESANQIFAIVYEELRKIAQSKMAGEKQGVSIQATALVNEVWIKLIGNKSKVQFVSRGHFFVAASEAMRQILVDAARARTAAKRGSGQKKQNIEDFQLANVPTDHKLLELDEALCDFEKLFPVKAKLVNLRYFSGMQIAEAAQHLGISPATAGRYWAFARAWLKQRLSDAQT